MVNLRNNYQKWPKWLRTLFSTIGFFFVSFVLIILARRIIDNNFIIDSKQYIKDNGKLIASVAEILVLFLTVRVISLTIKQETNPRNIAASILFSLLGISLVLILESFNWSLVEALFIPVTGAEEQAAAPTSVMPTLAAVSGVITAMTGLYGQFISSRKIQGELELAKQQLILEQKKIELEASKIRKNKFFRSYNATKTRTPRQGAYESPVIQRTDRNDRFFVG
jgi:hypothetical protein